MNIVKLNELSRKYNTDKHVVKSMSEALGVEETENILRMQSYEINRTARVNLLKTTREEALDQLAEEGIIGLPHKDLEEAITIIENKESLGHSISYLQGLVTPQGLGSMLTIHLLDPKPNEIIFDMAAAPGGKTTFIAERMKNTGLVIANDRSFPRLKALISNLNRHGIKNTIVTNQDAVESSYKKKFDRVLLDAPCTGEGLVVSNPMRRKSKKPEDPYILQRVQQQLLNAAIKSLKPDGQLVYSTCSLNQIENEEVLEPYLKKLEIINLRKSIRPYPIESDGIKGTIRLLPSIHSCDGFFIALLKKSKRS